MNEAKRKEAAFLRKLPSTEAANYLLERYADSYPVTIKHRSWKVADQFRLARHFLQGRAFAGGRPYEDFLSFMSLENFMKVVTEELPDIPEDRFGLLFYYLVPSLRKAAKNDLELKKVQEFIDHWSTGR